MSTSAIAVEVSGNVKTGPISTTYVVQQSCPDSCPMRDAGCYAETGMVGIYTRRLNRATPESTTPEQLAESEAQALARLTGSLPLRLHVVGDCTTSKAARIVSRAIARWKASVWSYTHAWREVKRSAWKGVSILASCENLAQVKLAMKRGYAAAIVVPELPRDGKTYRQDGFNVIPCPAQTRPNVRCVDCKLCWRDGWLRESRSVIAFEAHGSRKRKVSELVRIGA